MTEQERRLTVRLAGEAALAIDRIAELTGAKVADVVRRALGTELFLLEQKRKGAKVLIKDEDGVRELVLR